MATVCGASLALLDAGVPVSDSVAGIAMGLIKEGDEFIVLRTSLETRTIWGTWISKLQEPTRESPPSRWT